MAVYENWYASRPAYFERVLRRARLYLFHIVEETHRRGLPTEIALLPMVESAFEPRARSRSGAVGLWQFIPTTGKGYGLRQNGWYDERRDVISATRAALDYLEFLHSEFDGDWFLALAAYNAGENRVRKAMNFNRRRGRSTHYTALQLRAETKRYVPKLIAIRNIIAAPHEHAIRLAPIANEPFFARLELEGPLDLTLAAKLGGVSLKTMHALNPAPSNGITPPDGPRRLLVPVGGAPRMRAALRALPREQRVRWLQHTVTSGEYLGRIARRYDVGVADIKRVNRLRGDLLRVGQHLVIPVRADPAGTPRDAHLHLVRRGDTLWAISRRYGVYVSQLAQWNGISTADVLRVGQQIVVRGE
ncbi:MAG: LysM peptidoglycan-binding domain-containing protein [Gammaproteobacteria bacterium]|nr:LysM peptidoglycan-binding domain-containing protein [Gammaproteobacteria bacterium]